MTVTSILDRVVLFAGLPADEQRALATCLRRRWYSKNEVIFHRGDAGSSMLIIEEGSVKIELTSSDGKEIQIAMLGPGAFFGEVALMDEGERSADAIATDNTQLLVLDREDLLQFLQARPEVALRLIVVLSQRLRVDAQLVENTVFLDVPARLANAIMQLAETCGHADGERLEIKTHLTQTDLAAMVGASRETVNKCLGSYEKQGLLEYRRGHITVLRPDRLRRRIAIG
jgi:CRP/FNR family transcriptional regulator, cyclic AMP receptor protein